MTHQPEALEIRQPPPTAPIPQTPFPVHLNVFAIYQEVIGTDRLTLEVNPGTTVGDLCTLLIRQYPDLSRWQTQTRFGVNLDFVPAETLLQPQDEVVLIPPVSGG